MMVNYKKIPFIIRIKPLICKIWFKPVCVRNEHIWIRMWNRYLAMQENIKQEMNALVSTGKA